jgi:hypothetical protein
MKLFLLISVILQPALSSVFKLNNGPVCDNVGINVSEVICKSTGTNMCALGDVAYVTGTVTIGSSGIAENLLLTNKACVYGMSSSWTSSATCVNYAFTVDFCTTFNLQNTGCPSAGTYSIQSAKIDIPDAGQYASWIKWSK